VVVRRGRGDHAAGGRGSGQDRAGRARQPASAGDLLFYHTDPTDPGYISHVAIYLGDGKMVQAPETGENVEVVRPTPAASSPARSGWTRRWPPQWPAPSSGFRYLPRYDDLGRNAVPPGIGGRSAETRDHCFICVVFTFGATLSR